MVAFETYKDRTLVQMKIYANQQNVEIERLQAALAAARNRIDDDTATINRQVLALAGIRNVIYNVEQGPKQYSVEDLLQSMRRALGVRQDERI